MSFVARINLVVLFATIGINIPIVISERNDPSADGRTLLIDYATKILYQRSRNIVFQTKKAQDYFGVKYRKNEAGKTLYKKLENETLI